MGAKKEKIKVPMTERFYIQRLKKMVHKYGKELCGHCPLDFKDETGCIICCELADVDFSRGLCPSCPCPVMKNRRQDPYSEALKIIEAWEMREKKKRKKK